MELFFLFIGLFVGIVGTIIAFRTYFNKEYDASQKSIMHQMKMREQQMQEELQKYKKFEDQARSEQQQAQMLREEVSGLKVRLQEQQNGCDEKVRFLEEIKERSKEEFKELAAEILEQNSQKATQEKEESKSKPIDNSPDIKALLKPLQKQVETFQSHINDLYSKEAKDRTLLQKEIQDLKSMNERIRQDAVNLTNAIKGETQQQGVWGEMILEKVLESSGLREGYEFDREVVMNDNYDERKTYKPDVIVHLPNNRDIIIDSKVSLATYEQYMHEKDDEKREMFKQQHAGVIKQHINKLAKKDYSKLEGVRTLDFVFMFIPIEGALQTALDQNGRLYEYAFEQHIVLVTPTTLLVALRAVENTWRYERQSQDVQEIASRAGELHDKFVGFMTDMGRINEQIGRVQKTFDEAYDKLSSGKGNLVSQAHKLKEMGAQTSKALDPHMVSKAVSQTHEPKKHYQKGRH
jgi:DNA recombination protein RmuC